MVEKDSALRQIIEILRRQRVRQGDFKPVLECVIVQAAAVAKLDPTAPLAAAAHEMKSRALELQRVHSFVQKFVVEDLLEESIARLERAQRR